MADYAVRCCAGLENPQALCGDCSTVLHERTTMLRSCAFAIVAQHLGYNFVLTPMKNVTLFRKTILPIALHFRYDEPCKTQLVRCSIYRTLSHGGGCDYLWKTQHLKKTKHKERVLRGQAWIASRWPSAQSTVGCNRKWLVVERQIQNLVTLQPKVCCFERLLSPAKGNKLPTANLRDPEFDASPQEWMRQSPRLECTNALGSTRRTRVRTSVRWDHQALVQRAPPTMCTALFAVPSVMSSHRLAMCLATRCPGTSYHIVVVPYIFP